MELAELLVVLMLGVEVFRPLRELSQLFHQGLLGMAATQSVLEIEEAQPLTPDAEAEPIEALEPRIEFENVTFSYPTGRRPALNDVSFSVEPGKRIGVVGRSGSGKSTLVWLLQRLYTPQEGTIRLGGRNLNDLRFADFAHRWRWCCKIRTSSMVRCWPTCASPSPTRPKTKFAPRLRRRTRTSSSTRCRGLRDGDRRAWTPPLRRRAPANRDCASAAARRADVDSRRGALQRRRRERGHDPGGAGSADAGSDDANHGASALERARLRRDSRIG